MQDTWVWSQGWEDPWRWAWQSTPVFLPGESPWTEGLASYSPWGRKESEMTEKHNTAQQNKQIDHCMAISVVRDKVKKVQAIYISLI